MRPRPHRPLRSFVALLILASLALVARGSGQGPTIGFAEEFALSTDRAQTLAKLIPGTEDHFFYSCLVAQHEGRTTEVPTLLAAWIERHGRTSRVVEIENRQALLLYQTDPAAAFAFVAQRLGLSFAHQRQVPGAVPDLPTRLDPELIAARTLTRRALQLHPGSLNGFRDRALPGLAASRLDDNLLTDLLRRLRHPDVPNLPALVVRQLALPRSGAFGSLPIHDELLADQLLECARLRPALLDEAAFVNTYLRRLQPSADVNWREDPDEREAYLGRLQAFTDRLSSAHNSLRAHVLYHRLAHDLANGTPSRDTFLAYLRLPRTAGYANPEYVRRLGGQRGVVMDASQAFGTGFPSIGDDEPLVRAYLEHLLADAESYDRYAEFLRADWLRRVFAETKILAGVGDMQRWYALLGDPSYYEQLRDRVEILFPPTVRTRFGVDDPVSIDVDVKNVENLLVKVFEIHTLNFLLAEGREVDASIDLDGLVANEESRVQYAANPLRRIRRSFDFPTIDHPGVFVVELIGNGLSSRALIRKGNLQLVEHSGAAGHVVRVLDEAGLHQPNATLWLAGREFTPDERGEITVPYSTDPGPKSVILRDGDFAALAQLAHREEEYELSLGAHVDREALLPDNTARILIRPTLALNQRPIGIEFLEAPVLTVRAIDQDGIESTQDIDGLTLADDRETVHEIKVPRGLVRLDVALRGKVRNLSLAREVDLSAAARTFDLNRIDATAQTGSALLGRTPEGFVLDVLGKDGEQKVDRAVQLTLRHRDYADPVQVTLKTDAVGRITLGSLDGVFALQAGGFPGEIGAWDLRTHERTWPASLQGVAGQVLRVPLPDPAQVVDRGIASLIELRDGRFANDAFDRLAVAAGYLELRGLTAGDYLLLLKGPERSIRVRVTGGEVRDGWAVGRDRALEVDPATPMDVTGVAVAGDALVVTVAHAGPSTRIHVFATRYLPPFDAFDDLVAPNPLAPDEVWLARALSDYHAGREIGEEYRYILERRFATKFPGNMLQRPSLLLNPWALDTSVSALGLGAGEGGRFGGRRGGSAQGGRGRATAPDDDLGIPPGEFPNLAFLPRPSGLLANLRPGDDGVVRVSLADLGEGHLVHVVAVDDRSTVRTSIALPERQLEPEPRHLRRGLDPARHYARTRGIEFVGATGSAVIDDARTAQVVTYDSIEAVFQLFRTVSGDGELPAFAFVTSWPGRTDEEKRALYSKHACHELHFFLHQKDRPFFDAVVRPYLANKLHKTFLDQWLLGEDLVGFLDPWAFARLNAVEKVLLAQRVERESAAIARQIREIVELAPPDPQRVEMLFRSALASHTLADDDGLASKLGELQDALKDKDAAPARRQRAGAPPAAAAPAEKVVEEAEMEEPADDAQNAPQADRKAKSELERARRDAGRELYRAPDPTQRFVEQNYWHRRIEEQVADLVRPNAFWLDYATATPDAPFVSTNVVEASNGNFTELMLALAVLDLPFVAGDHQTQIDGAQLTLRAASPLLLVRQQIAAVDDVAADARPVLVSQNVFRLDEPYRFEGNERRDAYLTGELLVDVAYGCRVVVTNPTSSARNLELLMQIPEGAIPVARGFETRGVPHRLEPYSTTSVEFAFYFPAPGPAPQFPVHVTEDGRLLASAPAVEWSVAIEPSTVDTASWEYVSQNASNDEVLRFLDQNNLFRFDLARIAWRMRDRPFFDSALARLRARHLYHDLLWSYGVHHRDEVAAREFLRHADALLSRCGRALESKLVSIDPVERRSYEHIEFDPLFNPRAHRFGRSRTILNAGVAEQYFDLLDVLTYRPTLDSEDWLSVTYYMLLQDRTEEALAAFARVEARELPTRLQYDYLRAYLDFFSADHAIARGIAERYRDHPVARWQRMFREVLAELDEAEGKSSGIADSNDDRTRRQTELAERQPSLELTVEGRRVGLQYANLGSCRISYFAMDVEFLFSTHPFVQQGSGAFAYVRPNRSDVIELPADQREIAFDLPDDFRNANVLVEVSGGGVTRRQPHFANSLSVRWIETYGQVQVVHADGGRPLPKVYVKVFAQLPDGSVRFHKDGYTDLRGRFDYASLSGPDAANVARFAILVLSEEHGAVVREVAPPAR